MQLNSLRDMLKLYAIKFLSIKLILKLFSSDSKRQVALQIFQSLDKDGDGVLCNLDLEEFAIW